MYSQAFLKQYIYIEANFVFLHKKKKINEKKMTIPNQRKKKITWQPNEEKPNSDILVL